MTSKRPKSTDFELLERPPPAPSKMFTNKESQEPKSMTESYPRASVYTIDLDAERNREQLQESNLRGTSFLGYVFQSWLLEILSLVIGLLALVAIIVVLLEYNGQPLPDWPFGITMNSLISVFAKVLGIGLMMPIAEVISQAKWIWFTERPRRLADFEAFDSASRGSFGSLQFLLKTRGGILASAAAFLTILALAIDPFTQQIISYQSRLVAAGGATVPRSISYNSYSFGSILAIKDITLPMKAAIYNGIFNTDQSLFSISPDCPTGNCTWPTFSSLGVCSQCINSTDSIERKCTGSGMMKSCNMSLPDDGVSLSSGGLSTNAFLKSITGYKFPGLPVYPSGITGLQVLAIPDNGIGQEPPTAYSCTLYFCVKTYQAAVNSGTFNESILYTFPNSSTADSSGASVDARGAVTLDPMPGHDGPFTVPFQAKDAMSYYLSDLFTGNGTGGIGESSYTSDAMQALYTAMTAGRPGNNSTTTLSDLLDNLAASITRSMRLDNSSAGTSMVNGTAFKSQTFMSVQLCWLILPIAILAIDFVLVFSIIWRTARRRLIPFKSSSLATIFAGLTEQKWKEIDGTIKTKVDMDEAAERLMVALMRGGDGKYQLG
ncbi:hypothetical protein VTN00DRAFT_8423 [Thermoascus crustaceus]|uniref:uncharacterized protein n=1 Tax=Thermoascus crustaceus TaxID=5088 RepID=UPI003744A3CC